MGKLTMENKTMKDITARLDSILPSKDGVYIRNSVLSKSHGEIFTPVSLIDRMIEIANPQPQDKILDLCAGYGNFTVRLLHYFLEKFSIEPEVSSQWIWQNELNTESIEKINYVLGDLAKIIPGDAKNLKQTDLLNPVKKPKKFDLIISNPPYNRGLDIQILNNVYDLGEKIVLVHPSKWIYNKKPNTFKFYKDAIEKIQNDFTHFEVVKDANRLFGIGLFTDVAITMFEKDKGKIDPATIDIHGSDPIYLSAREKILNYCRNTNNLLKEVKYTGVGNKISKELEWEVGFSGIGCNIDRKDFLAIIRNGKKPNVGENTEYELKYHFDSKLEAQNFLNYLKLKITRFCLKIFKTNQIIHFKELSSVPYLPTYTKAWSDEDVAAEIGLTAEELAWAINWVPDYYPEDAEKYEKLKKNFEVGFSGISPSGKLAFIGKTTDEGKHIGVQTEYILKYYFDTYLEAQNFLKYLKTKIARFCLSIYKMNQHLESGEIASVPYLPTYTKAWSDEDVAAEIGLTAEELVWCINWVPDYYPEDKEKYSKYKPA